MRIGIFADSHDHLEHLRRAVDEFNRAGCECVLFAGDLVSPIAVPALRGLRCRLVGCFGDNEGNKPGILAGMSIIGSMADPPVRYVAPDGTRFHLGHTRRQVESLAEPFDVGVYAHTHKPSIHRDEQGRLMVNPGEAGGWVSGRATIVILETQTKEAKLIDLNPHEQKASARSS